MKSIDSQVMDAMEKLLDDIPSFQVVMHAQYGHAYRYIGDFKALSLNDAIAEAERTMTHYSVDVNATKKLNLKTLLTGERV